MHNPAVQGNTLPMLTYRTFYGIILVMSLLLARSVTSRPMTSSSTSALPSSHLLFYLALEKELIPKTADLAQRALHLLQQECGVTYKKRTSDCLTKAEQLPVIPALGDFPSQKTLEKEGTKFFTKHLLREAYVTVHKLERLLEQENGEVEPFQPVSDLIDLMNSTRQRLKDQIQSLFRFPIQDRKLVGLQTAKRWYTRRPRTMGGNCPEKEQDCLSLADYRLRLLFTLYSRLLRVSHVMDYTVRLSWLSVEHNTTFS